MELKYGTDDEVVGESKMVDFSKKRKLFAYWSVGGEEYKLKLSTAGICRLESQWNRSLIDIVSSGSMPPLPAMLTITQEAMKQWHHGIGYSDVQKMYDTYLDEGGSQLKFFSDVIMPVMSVSGFFTKSQSKEMDAKLEEMKDEL